MENLRTIADVNRMVRSIVEAETLGHHFSLVGKIERYYKSDLGHIYFDLVDGDSRVHCVIFEELAGGLSFELHNGLEVTVTGDIRFYEARGSIEIKAQSVSVNDQARVTRPVIEQLRAEGLYPARKKMPPGQIRRIGVITSRSSRAIGDFENAYRSANSREVLAPYDWEYVLLEGERAPQTIVDAIHALDSNPACDVIAIIRGGGLGINLATFDDIEIARAILKCHTFLVTGIGHYQDSTLADKVADHAAATPTAVASYLAQLCLPASGTSDTVSAVGTSRADGTRGGAKDWLKWLLLALFGLLALAVLALMALAGETGILS